VADSAAAAPDLRDSAHAAKRSRLTTKKVNVSVKDADIRDVLTFLAREGRTNIVMSRNVRGSITLYLERVTVASALRAVLKVHALDMIEEGNVILVMTRKEMLDHLEHRRFREGRR